MIQTVTSTQTRITSPEPIKQVPVDQIATITRVRLDPSDQIVGRSEFTEPIVQQTETVEVVEPKAIKEEQFTAGKKDIQNPWDQFPPRVRNIFHSSGYNPNDNSERYQKPKQPPVEARTMEDQPFIKENGPDVLAQMQLVYNNGYAESGRKPVYAPKSILEEDTGRLLLTGSRSVNIYIKPMPKYMNETVSSGLYGTDRIKGNVQTSEELKYLSTKYA